MHAQEPPAVMAAESVRQLRLAASCPQCGSRPAIRVTPAVVQAMARQPPQARMGTYQCHRRRCGAIFDLAQLSGVGAGRPMVDMEFRLNEGNPYDPPGTLRDSRTQAGFATFGPLHLLQALLAVQGLAARAVWWQKWGVHRRLRPVPGRNNAALPEARRGRRTTSLTH